MPQSSARSSLIPEMTKVQLQQMSYCIHTIAEKHPGRPVSSMPDSHPCAHDQEFDGALKIVKIEADPCPHLVEKYKVSKATFCPHLQYQSAVSWHHSCSVAVMTFAPALTTCRFA